MSARKVLSYHWKLKILESIQMSAPKLPEEEFSMIVDTLIDDYRIKNMVTRALASMDSYEEYFRQQKEKEQEIEGELKAL